LPLGRWILAVREHFEKPLIGGDGRGVPEFQMMQRWLRRGYVWNTIGERSLSSDL
jgi:hypothetical protein